MASSGTTADESPAHCPFCRIVRGELPAATVYQDDQVLAILDLYPATRGHVLVMPKQHVRDLFDLSSDLAGALMETAAKIATSIRAALKPDGFNLIQANGQVAGQTINHFHIHLVPRYGDDSVRLKFGHGNTPADLADLRRLAAELRG